MTLRQDRHKGQAARTAVTVSYELHDSSISLKAATAMYTNFNHAAKHPCLVVPA